MSRTNDVNIAMQYAKSGVDGVHLMDSHKATIGWVVNTLAAEVERLEAEHIEAMAAITAVSRAAGQERTRAETAEARVRELEAQYACKRHNGEEAPEAAAQLTDDMLRSCQICGLTVDISKGHCEPTIEFTMRGRTDKKTKKLAELEAKNARLRGTLMRVTGSLGLVLKGAGIAAPAHKENYHAAKKLIEETFSGDREEAST